MSSFLYIFVVLRANKLISFYIFGKTSQIGMSPYSYCCLQTQIYTIFKLYAILYHFKS